jgi:hypothetical protein
MNFGEKKSEKHLLVLLCLPLQVSVQAPGLISFKLSMVISTFY